MHRARLLARELYAFAKPSTWSDAHWNATMETARQHARRWRPTVIQGGVKIYSTLDDVTQPATWRS